MSVDPATIGAKIVLTGISLLMAPKIEGPRLKTLEVTTADYGTPYPEVDGYCRIDGSPIGWAEPLREKKVESKTKGGKFADYKYFGTWWAIGAGHEVDSIPRIWMDRHLVFDLTQAGPISIASGFFEGIRGSPIKLTQGRNMRIYLGTETQGIDPRYEEWCEDRYGPDSATARRGTAGVMFEEIPLEKFGNRIPQISMAILNDPDPSNLFETFDPGAAIGPVFTQDFSRFLFYDLVGNAYSIWDTATRTNIINGTLPINGEHLAYDSSGRIWGTGDTLGSKLRMFSGDGFTLLSEVEVGTFSDHVYPIGSYVYLRPHAGSGTTLIQCNATICTLTDIEFSPSMFFADLTGAAWTIGLVGTDLYLRKIGTGDQWIFSTPGGITGHHSAFVNADGDFFVVVNTTAILIDAETMTITDSQSIGGSASQHFNVMIQVQPGAASFFTETKEIDAATLDTKRTYSMGTWTSDNQDLAAYEPITHSLFAVGSGDLTIRYLDRVGASGTTLASIVSRKCLRRGIPADAFDVTDIPQPVIGYWTIQGTGADQIGPLLDIHDVDAVPHNYGLYFRTRGDAADALIESEEFHAKDSQRFDLSMVPESRIPARVEFNYADNTADQQPNTASDPANTDRSGDTQNKKVFDLTTYVDVPDEAQPKVNRYGRRQWFEREIGEATLDVTYARLEPGDVKTLDIDGEQRSVRFTELTRSGLLVQAKWVRDDPRVHDITAQAGPTFDGRDLDTIYVTSPTKAVVMDIPFLNDEENDDRPLLHFGAGNYGGGNWPGAIIWWGEFENGEYEQWNAVDSADKAVWGYCIDVLPDPESPWVWDRGSVIEINLKGTLTSATEAEILADPSINQATIGAEGRWEIVNFTTATLIGGDIWELSGFLRGRRGTEWACSLHAVGDEFWLGEDLKRESYGLSNVGLEEDFKGQSLGRDPAGTEPIEVQLNGNTLRPYAPANLTAERDLSNGNWTITGRRRTRIGGAWVGGTQIPLSEASEAYEVIIMDGVEEKRSLDVTIDGDGNFSATYSAADQTTDFGSAQPLINVEAYQLSDAVGRGFPATLGASELGDILSGNITAGTVAYAVNDDVTPVNPSHTTGDTLLCVVMVRGTGASVSLATAGWTDADGITNPTTMNGNRMWLFQNECDSTSELDPELTVTGGSGSETVIAVVLRIPGRDTTGNFVLGTVSSNGSNNSSIAFAQNSPSIDDGNAIIAIGVKNNNPIGGSSAAPITGQTAGLDWTKLVAFESSAGNDSTFSIDFAVNDSGSAYTAGTSGVVTASYSVGAVSAAVYLEVPLL